MKFKQSVSKKIFDIYAILKKISTFKHIFNFYEMGGNCCWQQKAIWLGFMFYLPSPFNRQKRVRLPRWNVLEGSKTPVTPQIPLSSFQGGGVIFWNFIKRCCLLNSWTQNLKQYGHEIVWSKISTPCNPDRKM